VVVEQEHPDAHQPTFLSGSRRQRDSES
jgi:hypothetical protein